jgi:hypothetical protein
MFATARYASVLALAGAVVLGQPSAATAADRLTDKPLPQVDFTLAANGPFVPGVAVSIPPALLTEAVAEATPAAPLAEAVQTRPVDLTIPGSDGGFGSTTLRRGMIVSFAALQVFDALSTRKALASGASEANPAMAGIAKNSTALFAVKAGSAAATAFFVERLAKKHPRGATIVMTVLNTAYAAVVAHNYRVAQQNAR